MKIFERIITEDRGIMKEYENIVNPLVNFIIGREKDIINNPDKNSGLLIKEDNGVNTYQYEIPQEKIPKSSWYNDLTIRVTVLISTGGTYPCNLFNSAGYTSTDSYYANGKIKGGLIEINYNPCEMPYVRRALGHEFMHLYEDYNRLKNKRDNPIKEVKTILTITNGAYKEITDLAQDSNPNIALIGAILYYLTDCEQNAIVQEIYSLVEHNRNINEGNYKEMLCKESKKYNDLLIIRDRLLKEIKTMTDRDFVYIQKLLSNIFASKCDSLAFRESFIYYVEQSLISLIKKINRAIHYGIEAHSALDHGYRDEPIITSFINKENKWGE